MMNEDTNGMTSPTGGVHRRRRTGLHLLLDDRRHEGHPHHGRVPGDHSP